MTRLPVLALGSHPDSDGPASSPPLRWTAVAVGCPRSISLFEDQASLKSALALVDGWSAVHHGVLESGAAEVAIGEVVAQSGL